MTQAELADQPALGPDRQLLDASKITWHHDPDDPHPIQSTSGVQGQCSWPIRTTAGTQLADTIAAEKLDKNGLSCHRFIQPHNAKASARRKQPIINKSHGDAMDTDTEDQTFAISVSKGECDDDLSDSDSDSIEIGNNEVWITWISSWFRYKLI